MNNFELCNGVCGLHDKIIGAGIIEKAKLVAMYAKPGAPMPNEQEFQKLFLQTEVIASIARSNASLFGDPRFFSIHFEDTDLYFFLLSRSNRSGVLAIQLLQPYNHGEIVSKVGKYLELNI